MLYSKSPFHALKLSISAFFASFSQSRDDSPFLLAPMSKRGGPGIKVTLTIPIPDTHAPKLRFLEGAKLQFP